MPRATLFKASYLDGHSELSLVVAAGLPLHEQGRPVLELVLFERVESE